MTETIIVRKSEDRGHADHGWLNSRHTFSFAGYHDPAYMGFRSLRVINQDKVAPGGGFSTHPHRNMEIFSYVLEGALEHKDSMGHGRILEPGQIQLMSAGSGITHSEFNPSSSEGLHFLQIWIQPHTGDLEPTYTEWHPDACAGDESKVLVISPDGREGSARIRQDAEVYRIRLAANEETSHHLNHGRGLWLQVIDGPVFLNGAELSSGDAGSSEVPGDFNLRAGDAPVEALLFDIG